MSSQTMTVQLEQLAIAMASSSPKREEQAARTLRAQQEATRAADESIAALREMVAQLQAQRASDLASFQGRIAVLERTVETQRTQITALEALQTRNTKLIELIQLEAQDTCKMQKFLGKFPKRTNGGSPRGKAITTELEKLQQLIDARHARPRDSVMDSALQESDTKKLVSFAAATSSNSIPQEAELRKNILFPLIAARQARVRECH